MFADRLLVHTENHGCFVLLQRNQSVPFQDTESLPHRRNRYTKLLRSGFQRQRLSFLNLPANDRLAQRTRDTLSGRKKLDRF